MRARSKAEVHSVTDAPVGRKQEVRSREVRYLISMGVRTLCFILAFVTSGPLRWSFVVAAFVLPYVAVVMANAGRERDKSPMPKFQPNTRVLPSLESRSADPDSTHSKGKPGSVN